LQVNRPINKGGCSSYWCWNDRQLHPVTYYASQRPGDQCMWERLPVKQRVFVCKTSA